MMGHRGGWASPSRMQIRAIFESAAELKKRQVAEAELMVPSLATCAADVKGHLRPREEVQEQTGVAPPYGTMIESAGCLLADNIPNN